MTPTDGLPTVLADVVDARAVRTVLASETRFDGHIWRVRTDTVDLGDGQTVRRDVLEHPGAVGIVAVDDDDNVLLVQQYRHAVAALLWEPPAGLLDVAGEEPWAAAQRELLEETGYRAGRWNVLADFFNSPGGSNEAFRCFLARDVIRAPAHEQPVGEGEERDMPTAWVPLDHLVAAVLEGRLHNPTAVVGVLAAHTARAVGWDSLRPADAPWPWRTPPSP